MPGRASLFTQSMEPRPAPSRPSSHRAGRAMTSPSIQVIIDVSSLAASATTTVVDVDVDGAPEASIILSRVEQQLRPGRN